MPEMRAGPVDRVTIVVPVYGTSELDDLLQAIRKQSFTRGTIDVILVDNHDTPMLQVDDGPGIRVIHEPTPGSYAARNTGAAAATGEILAFTDADGLPQENWVEEGVRLLVDGPNRIVGGEVLTTIRARPSVAEMYEKRFAFPQREYVANGYSVTANLFIRRSDFEELGGFDERLHSGGDRELGHRAVAKGYRYVYAPGAVVEHPARQTLSAIVAKTRRVQTGSFDIARIHRGRVGVVKHVLRRARPPIDRVRATLRDDGLPVGLRLQVAGVCVLDYVVTVWTCLRRMLPRASAPPRT